MTKREDITRAIKKILSANDCGSTGAHQAGILIPKNPDILSFFPSLDRREKNPRVHLLFTDDDNQEWEFAFIYYNNALFGGTRNEYRLTRMTAYINANDLRAGDEVLLLRDNLGSRYVSYRRTKPVPEVKNGVLRLKPEWKVIDS